MLYQPTPREIGAVIVRSLEKHPNCKPLESRLQRAAEILADIERLYFSGATWHCESSAADELAYTLNFSGCTCPDAARHRDLINGRAWCKHRLALVAYREIMIEHIRARCMGTMNGGADYNRLRMAPNAGLLIARNGGALLYCEDYYNRIPTPICHGAGSARGHAPQSEADLHAFAVWLAQAQPLPTVVEAWLTYDRLVAAGNTDADAAAAADEALIAAYAADDRW